MKNINKKNINKSQENKSRKNFEAKTFLIRKENYFPVKCFYFIFQ